MKKIVIVSGIQIINNPRVVKEATLLSKAGYDVEVIGAIFDSNSKKRINKIVENQDWLHIPVVDMSMENPFTKLDFMIARIKLRFSYFLKEKLNIEIYTQLGYYVNRIYGIAKKRKADLYIVHLEQALWVGQKLIRDGYKVAIDFEDWYSEDGLPADRAKKPEKLMKTYESYLLKNAIYSSTTSKSLSQALCSYYSCPAPTVIYNSFPTKERNKIDEKVLDRKNTSIPSIVWFSQTIGPGRGLEQLIDAINDINIPFELHIRGDDIRGFGKKLLSKASKDTVAKIFLHPQVSEEELLSRISEHDIGYCGDLGDCKSRDFTITNKMMEYLRAGIAVLASDTAGHKEIKNLVRNSIRIFTQHSKESLINELMSLLSDKEFLEKIKNESKAGIVKELSWEYSSQILLSKIESSI